MAAELNHELRYKTEILDAANNKAEINQMNWELKEKVGNRAFDEKDGKVKWGSLPLIDMILAAIKSGDSAGLKEILEHAQISLDNPIIAQSIASNLELQGMKKEDISKFLSEAGLSSNDKSFQVGRNITASANGALFDVSAGPDIGGLLAFLSGKKDKGKDSNEAADDLISFLGAAISGTLKSGLELFQEMVSKDAVFTVEDEESNKKTYKRDGLANKLATDELLKSEDLDRALENLKTTVKVLNIKGSDAATVDENDHTKTKTTISQENADISRSLIEKHGAKGVDAVNTMADIGINEQASAKRTVMEEIKNFDLSKLRKIKKGDLPPAQDVKGIENDDHHWAGLIDKNRNKSHDQEHSH